MARWLRVLSIALALLVVGSASAAPSIDDLVERLTGAEDFRVRVSAALELGKSKDRRAREPLERALDDGNAAVRAASAAALKALGDPRALPALKQKRLDKSVAVRTQVEATIVALEQSEANGSAAAYSPKVLVMLGAVRNGTTIKSKTLDGTLERTSREKLSALPEVEVLASADDMEKTAQKKKLPVVMLTGKLRRFKASREGTEVVYTASIEYVVHRMPGQTIAGTVSGSASARATTEEASDRKKSAELQRAVLEAAIGSAMRRAPQALLAAANM
jgi:hypothetical protein